MLPYIALLLLGVFFVVGLVIALGYDDNTPSGGSGLPITGTPSGGIRPDTVSE